MVPVNLGKSANLTERLKHMFIHLFVATHSLIRTPTGPLAAVSISAPRLHGPISLGLFPPSPQTSLSPFSPLFSFPMAVFYFRRKLMKIVETRTTKRNLIFFNIRQ